MKPNSLPLIVAAMVAGCLVPVAVPAQDQKPLFDLRGQWKFELGDDMRWSDPKFNDSTWETIFTPSPWEDEGFPGYDGYAWYRKRFTASPDWKGKSLYLDLGLIDDVDEVYVNGHFIGFSGSFPPGFVTAFDWHRRYRLPAEYLIPGGENVIAVRVYDSQLGGGIVAGRIGIYEGEPFLQPDIPITGQWKLMTGDNMEWADPELDDRKWKHVLVPAHWETQGFRDYDGFAWYRVKFTVPSSVADQRMIMLLGKIDDFDETYLNGERIGRTGNFSRTTQPFQLSEDYNQLRAYNVPSGVLQPGKENVLAVRVYDGWMHGGIYDGPIGLISREKYVQWQKKQDRRDRWNLFDIFLK